MTASTPSPSWDVPVSRLANRRQKDWFRCVVHEGEVVVTPPAGPFVLSSEQVGEVRAALREAHNWALRQSQ